MAFELNMTEKTPEVLFDAEKGLFRFKGVIFPEDAAKFFDPLFKYVEVYFAEAKENTTLEIDLEYFNTSSSRMLFQFMKLFSDNGVGGASNVTIKWYYEADDPDMEEAGEEFSAMFDSVNFEMIIVKRPKIFELLNNN